MTAEKIRANVLLLQLHSRCSLQEAMRAYSLSWTLPIADVQRAFTATREEN